MHQSFQKIVGTIIHNNKTELKKKILILHSINGKQIKHNLVFRITCIVLILVIQNYLSQ